MTFAPPLPLSTRVDWRSLLLTVIPAWKIFLVVFRFGKDQADYKAVCFLTNISLTLTCGEHAHQVHIEQISLSLVPRPHPPKEGTVWCTKFKSLYRSSKLGTTNQIAEWLNHWIWTILNRGASLRMRLVAKFTGQDAMIAQSLKNSTTWTHFS